MNPIPTIAESDLTDITIELIPYESAMSFDLRVSAKYYNQEYATVVRHSLNFLNIILSDMDKDKLVEKMKQEGIRLIINHLQNTEDYLKHAIRKINEAVNERKLEIRIASLSEQQKITIRKLVNVGAKLDPKIKTVVWFQGHCILVKRNGETEDL